jgi:hypothetical protein
MDISVRVVGLDALLLKWAFFRDGNFKASVEALNAVMAPELQRMVQARAPRRTGAYANSITAEAHGLSISAGTSAPQADRLEYGFTGVDSLGRHYHQSPQPHFRPALDAFQEIYALRLAELVQSRAS